MARTRHIQQRMSQRGIKASCIEIVRQFGVYTDGDKIVLDRKAALATVDYLNQLKKELLSISKNKLVLVEANGFDITTYRKYN